MALGWLDKIAKKRAAPHLVTLGEPVNRMRELQALLEQALGDFKAVVTSAGELAPHSPSGLFEEHRDYLRALARRLGGEPTRSELAETRKAIEQELEIYGKKLEQHVRRQEREAKEVMAILAVMIESMASREKEYNVRFRGISKKIRSLASANNLAEIRQRLAEQVSQLERYVEDMARDTESAVARVRQDLNVTRGQRSEAWREVEVDPETQLPGPKRAEALIDERLRNEQRFSLAVIHLDQYCRLEESHGEETAVEALKAFAGRARERLEATAVLFRAGQAKLVALVEGGLPAAAARASELESELSGVYQVAGKAGPVSLPLACRATALSPVRGENGAGMLERIDAA